MITQQDRKYFKLAIGSSFVKRETDNDISARCPSCSSDKRWEHSSRLHLYTKNGVTNVNCFSGDCDYQNKTVYSFLRDFYPSLLEGYKRETFNVTMDKLNASQSDNSEETLFDIIARKRAVKDSDPVAPKKSPVTPLDLSAYFDRLCDRSDAQAYICGRGFDWELLQSKFGGMYVGNQSLEIDDKLYMLTNNIIIPIYNENRDMYGFYSRNIHEKVFYTFNPEVNFGYKVWNWFNVDLTKDVYIFEGIFDAISYAMSSGNCNVIATMGASLPADRIKELSSPIFVLDNDVSGFKQMLVQAKRNNRVFIQPRNIIQKDMNEMYISGLNCDNIVNKNLYTGIRAEIEINNKL